MAADPVQQADPAAVGRSSPVPGVTRLTPVRDEVAWIVLWLLLASLVAIIGFVSWQPSGADVGVACAVVLAQTLASLAWGRRLRPRLRRTFHEPLDTVPRERPRSMALRAAVPLGGLVPSLVFLVGDFGYDGVLRGMFCGVVVGIAVSFALPLRLVVRAERAAGGTLYYQRRGAKENRWVDQRALSKNVVYLVDDPDPDRWGEHRW